MGANHGGRDRVYMLWLILTSIDRDNILLVVIDFFDVVEMRRVVMGFQMGLFSPFQLLSRDGFDFLYGSNHRTTAFV